MVVNANARFNAARRKSIPCVKFLQVTYIIDYKIVIFFGLKFSNKFC